MFNKFGMLNYLY